MRCNNRESRTRAYIRKGAAKSNRCNRRDGRQAWHVKLAARICVRSLSLPPSAILDVVLFSKTSRTSRSQFRKRSKRLSRYSFRRVVRVACGSEVITEVPCKVPRDRPGD